MKIKREKERSVWDSIFILTGTYLVVVAHSENIGAIFDVDISSVVVSEFNGLVEIGGVPISVDEPITCPTISEASWTGSEVEGVSTLGEDIVVVVWTGIVVVDIITVGKATTSDIRT